MNISSKIIQLKFKVQNLPQACASWLSCVKIEQLVYELYGLTEEEIKIVEGKNKNESST